MDLSEKFVVEDEKIKKRLRPKLLVKNFLGYILENLPAK